MTIHVSNDGTVQLAGDCPAEDAELLLQQVLMNPGVVVDWSACESAHAAVIQVLLVAGLLPTGTPLDTFLRDKVAVLLRGRT